MLSMTRVSRYVDTFDRTPSPFENPGHYAQAVGDIARKQGVKLIMPAHEDFAVLDQFRDALPRDVTIAAPKGSDRCNVLDKWKLIERAAVAGVRVPETHAPESIEEADQLFARACTPVIIKPRRGNGGKGVILIRDAREGAFKYRDLVRRFGLEPPSLPLVQQYIPGALFGSCFIAIDGEVRACFIERYLRCKQAGFGTSVFREPAFSAEILHATRRLCRELKWTGIAHLDFVADGTGSKAYLLEMNPRFWGALDLAVKNGFDFPRALVTLQLIGAFDATCFTIRSQSRSLWIAGELIACLDDIRNGRWLEAAKSPLRFLRARSFDDFRLRDPLPLIVELTYYFTGFLRAGGDVNPASAGMINQQHNIVCGPASN
jgi:biotin carboxylase